jgi:hypothetical protein
LDPTIVLPAGGVFSSHQQQPLADAIDGDTRSSNMRAVDEAH